MPLSQEPTPESLKALRERIEQRIAAGASKATLAKEMRVGERTLLAFIDNPDRKPFPNTWALYRTWFEFEEGKGAYNPAPTIGGRVAESSPEYGGSDYRLEMVAARARNARDMLRAALNEQEAVIASVEALRAPKRAIPDEREPIPDLAEAEADRDAKLRRGAAKRPPKSARG